MAITILEAFCVISVTQLSMIVYSRILPNNSFIEFLFFCIPQYLVFRYLKSAYLVYIALFAALLIFPKKHQRSYPKHKSSIDRIRMMIISIVSLIIYSANFKFYDSSRYGKSMGFEFLLMDIGVGSFVYNAGLVSYKANTRKKLINVLKCCFFGTLRLLSIILMKLNVKNEEFGHHLNFFYILAILNFISIFINVKNGFFIGIGLLIFHQGLLSLFLQEMLLKNQRNTFLSSNLEGISFIIPELGIYLICQEIGRILLETKTLKRITVYNCISVLLFSISWQYQEISRRLHNLPFTLIIVIINTTQLIAFEYLNKEYQLGNFEIAQFASKNMLFMLILSNILIPVSKYLGVFETENMLSIGFRTICFLFIVYYLPYIVKKGYSHFKA